MTEKKHIQTERLTLVLFPAVTDLSQVWPEVNQQFNKDIEDEANSYFQRIYNQPPHPTLSVDEVGVDWIFASLYHDLAV